MFNKKLKRENYLLKQQISSLQKQIDEMVTTCVNSCSKKPDCPLISHLLKSWTLDIKVQRYEDKYKD